MASVVFGSPTTQRLIWRDVDGSLRVTIPCEPLLPGESEALYLDRIALAALVADPGLANCTRVADLDAALLPASRRFRPCWRFGGGLVQVHLPVARQQRLDEIRDERQRRLLASDADKARLDDTGTPAQQAALAAYRQALRDLPATVQAELASLATATQLETYEPNWPAPL